MLTQLARAWDDVVDFLLPRLCCGCGERVHEARWLVCETCLDSIAALHEPLCVTCGCPDATIKGSGKCEDCPPGKIGFTKARGVTAYGGIAQLLVEKLKYQGRIEYAPLMALSMARIRTEAPSGAGHAPPPDLIVPVPLHPTRRRERGFNQAEVIAREFAELTKTGINEKALRRVKPTPSQTRLKKRKRRENIAGAFACANPDLVAGKHILLIDDVYTTGSTLNECSKTLIAAGAASVECLAYCRALLQ